MYSYLPRKDGKGCALGEPYGFFCPTGAFSYSTKAVEIGQKAEKYDIVHQRTILHYIPKCYDSILVCAL